MNSNVLNSILRLIDIQNETYSIAGHFAESLYAPLGMYAASKYALTALGSELRHEFIADKLKIKITVRSDLSKTLSSSC